jgi:hypothetical protein
MMADPRRSRNEVPGAAEKAAKKLRSYYKLGCSVLVRADKRDGSVKAAAEASTSSNTMNFDQATKAARFAKDFTEGDLETLCGLCVKPGNVPLVFTHIRRVLRVASQAERMRWLRRAAQNGWSSDRLDMEIGRSSDDESDRGGPRLTPPRDLRDALAKVRSQNRAWLKRYDAIWLHAEGWPPKLPLGETEAATLADRLKQERKRLGRLAAAAKALQGRLAEVENSLPRHERSSATSNGTTRGPKKRK